MASPLLNKLTLSPMRPKSPLVRSLSSVTSADRPRIITPYDTPHHPAPRIVLHKTPRQSSCPPRKLGFLPKPKLSISPSSDDVKPEAPKVKRKSSLPDLLSPLAHLGLAPLKLKRSSTSGSFATPNTPPTPPPTACSKDTDTNGPALALQFTSTRSCDALVQSPCRANLYTRARKHLYHHDSPRESRMPMSPLVTQPPRKSFFSNINKPKPLGMISDDSVSVGETSTVVNDNDEGGQSNCSSLSALSPPMPTPSPNVSKQRKWSSVKMPSNTPRRPSHSRALRSAEPCITPKLGNGGFGTVFIGKYDGQRAAIKQLYSRQQEDKAKEESLRAELNAFRLNHTNIVRILTFTSCADTTQVVFEYVGRHNLQQILEKDDDSMDAKWRCAVARDVAAALAFCHARGVVHLDVKASNVMVMNDRLTCKLADFGCSRRIPKDSDCVEQTSLANVRNGAAGTLIFKAPELLRGKPVTYQADTYAFGLLLWHCVSRRMPFCGMHPHTTVFLVVSRHLRPSTSGLQLDNAIDIQLIELAEDCWQHEPTKRPHFVQIQKRISKISHH